MLHHLIKRPSLACASFDTLCAGLLLCHLQSVLLLLIFNNFYRLLRVITHSIPVFLHCLSVDL
jgi:hypothetical protein